jgi:hypothetical protein
MCTILPFTMTFTLTAVVKQRFRIVLGTRCARFAYGCTKHYLNVPIAGTLWMWIGDLSLSWHYQQK